MRAAQTWLTAHGIQFLHFAVRRTLSLRMSPSVVKKSISRPDLARKSPIHELSGRWNTTQRSVLKIWNMLFCPSLRWKLDSRGFHRYFF